MEIQPGTRDIVYSEAFSDGGRTTAGRSSGKRVGNSEVIRTRHPCRAAPVIESKYVRRGLSCGKECQGINAAFAANRPDSVPKPLLEQMVSAIDKPIEGSQLA